MKKAYARSLPAAAKEEKRKQAVLLRIRGKTYASIAELLGVHERTVIRWIRTYEKSGAKGLKAKSTGRPSGTGRSLSQDQETQLQRLISDKTPDQLKLPHALWSRMAVKRLIEQEFSIKLAIRTIGKYLSLWGFAPRKPLKKAYEHNPRQVTQWHEETYPKIKEQAQVQKAEIHWGDGTGMRNDNQHERGYTTNMLSAITNQGKVRFKIFDGNIDTDILIDFMKRLIKEANRKVFLILDNIRAYHAKAIKVWLQEHSANIEVFFLPASSPELNSDEYLNCDRKHRAHSGEPTRTQGTVAEYNSQSHTNVAEAIGNSKKVF